MDIVDILNILLDFILSKYFYLPIIYILVGVVIYKILKKIVVAVFNRQSRLIGKNRKRYSTLVQVIVDFIKIIIIAFVLLSILTVYGVDVKAALAGLGIVSVIVGLAFQDLFKDFIVGFTIIIEDYFSVGDTIKIGEFKGEVTHIGLKSTRLKNMDGSILIISNRNIDRVINYSSKYSLAMVEIPVAYESDLDKVEKVLTDLFKKLNKSIKELKGDIEIWGVEELGDSAVVYKIAAQTQILQQFSVQRQIRKAVKVEFDKENIKIPYNQIEVHNGK